MRKHDWTHLNHLQIGKYAEYFTKMEFTLCGFDVYSAEVDDHGIDFVVRSSRGTYYDVQVKSIRNLNYVFFPKAKFMPSDNLLAVLVIFILNQEPALFLIPSRAWKTPNQLLVSRNYEGKKSEPEWGINLSRRNLPLLEPYRFENVIEIL